MAKTTIITQKKSTMLTFFVSLLIILCLAIDAWWFFILKVEPDALVSKTYNVGAQTITRADGSTETKDFMELNLYDDCFEIKFNYVRDENQNAFYSKGIQFYGSDGINFKDKTYQTIEKNEGTATLTKETFASVKEYYDVDVKVLNKNPYYFFTDIFQYASGDDYQTTLENDLNAPISEETLFGIQIGDELFGMKLKHDSMFYVEKNDIWGSKTVVRDEIEDRYFIGEGMPYDLRTEAFGFFSLGTRYYTAVNQNYRECDIYYLAEILYDSIKNLPNGTSQDILFTFDDLFNYYKYNEADERYYSCSKEDTAKIVNHTKSYYTIHVSKNEGSIKRATQSLFNRVKGSAQYDTSGTVGESIYFIGRTVVELTEADFEQVMTDDGFKLVLKEDFRNYHYENRNEIKLYIIIDETVSQLGNFLGVEEDSLKGFSIYRITGGALC